MKYHILHTLSLIAFLFVFMSCDDTDTIGNEVDPDGNTSATIVGTDTINVGDALRFPDTLIAYQPAPGQFINVAPGRPADAQSIIGQKGMVTLGGWGGYIIVGYKDPIINHPDNAYGVDFSIYGNAYEGSSEPGIVQVMKDENHNGLADDTWYELQGGEHQNKSTISNYELTYYYIDDTTITWKNNQNQSDTLLRNGYHSQSYYPSAELFNNYPQDSVSFRGTLLPTKSVEESAGHWVNPPYSYGYVDNTQVNWSSPLNEVDNPETESVEGAGGDAFKLEWAVDTQGQSISIDTVHFIKIYSAVQFTSPVLGDVSPEIKAIVAIK